MPKQAATQAVTAAGFLCHGDGSKQMLDLAAEHIFKLAGSKSEPLQFATGEALCFVFGGKAFTPLCIQQNPITIELFQLGCLV